MPPQIRIDQTGKPAGTPGQAREDLVTGVDVTLTATGGPFTAHQWAILDRAIDDAGTQASSVLTAPTSSATNVSPIDVAGTYHVELTVDSGSGLGANADDVTRLTFYAGPTLATDPAELPRREPALKETTEHNVPDVTFPLGNVRGWAQELRRWFSVVRRLHAAKSWAVGRVNLTGAGATLVKGHNVATVLRTGMGVVDVTFTRPATDALYSVVGSPRGATPGSASASGEAPAGFTITRFDAAGAPVDADFCFAIGLGV